MFGIVEMRERNRKTQKLFNGNPHPRTKGIGYGTAERARKSIKKLRGKDRNYRRQVATTMYYRAKYHKYQTQGMRESMKVWKKYMDHM
jgi:hypothetical protein